LPVILVKRNWTAVSLSDLIAAHVSAFNNPGELSVVGEVILLEPVAAEQLGLALYELASNCIKYGAWKQAGNASIEWSVTDRGFLDFRRIETGVREKPNNERQGFGKLILTTVVPIALSGSANWNEDSDGIVWHVSIHPQFFKSQHSSIPDALVPREATIPRDALDHRETSS
jgi:two-component sensor histidine kinase